MNMGNVDWRPLINLWSVLEYLSKYTAKIGKATHHIGKLFGDVAATVCEFEHEDGVHDLWRRTIMKFYSKLIGNRDYTLFEVVHFGLRLPGVLHSFGPVESVSLSNWASVKQGRSMAMTPAGDRATYRSKLELFNQRADLQLPTSVAPEELENISFYCFWRLYSVQGNRLRKRQREKMIALNGCGWPRQAKATHPLHHEYARKTLYAYAPCAGSRGTDYLHDVVRHYFQGSWAAALKHFVEDVGNHWCPTWIKRNYYMENPPDHVADYGRRLARALEDEVCLPLAR